MKIDKTGYYRTRCGDIVLVYGIVSEEIKECSSDCRVSYIDQDGDIYLTKINGFYYIDEDIKSADDIVEYLPDCTGFNWTPPPPTQVYVPWTFETMPDNVRCKHKISGNYALFTPGNVGVAISTMGYQTGYGSLLLNYIQLDGTPCGAKEKQ